MTNRKLTFAYLFLVGIPVITVFMLLARNGSWGDGGLNGTQFTHTGADPGSTLVFVLQILIIVAAARACGAAFETIRQPRVVGEMTAGILLGPSLLGWLAPAVSSTVFPAGGLSGLNAISQLGLLLFMFLVGLSLDPHELRHRSHAAVLISHASIAVPVLLGALLAEALYPHVPPTGVGSAAFALFMGAAMSITAFPVLARILSEHNMLRSPIGVVATACAAIDDVTGWCLLASVVVVVRGSSVETPLWVTIGGSLTFAAIMIRYVRPLLSRFIHAGEAPSDRTVALCLAVAFTAAATTEFLGIHLLFGAFLAGAVMPKRPDLTGYIVERLETLTTVILLPVFFAFTGLRTNIGLLNGPAMWVWTLVIIVVAIAGKLGGSLIAARCAGLRWKDGALLGVLMNTRGLMELVALNIGLDAGIIPPVVYSMMVVMALVTTFMTGPLVMFLGAAAAPSLVRPAAAEARLSRPA